ncbi:MAG: hypothetical protein H6633_06480 [Anaerolineales bacterium]|nr:hypothetical protein [Anaerolineales bacterium]
MKPFHPRPDLPHRRKPKWQQPTITTLTDEELLQQLGPAQAGSIGDGGPFSSFSSRENYNPWEGSQ